MILELGAVGPVLATKVDGDILLYLDSPYGSRERRIEKKEKLN